MDTDAWLLDSDPSIRWQVMRDLTDAPPDDVRGERARVAHEGWGADLLSRQGDDGLWRDPEEPLWVPNFYSMLALRDVGVDPADPAVDAAVDRLDAAYRWDEEFGAKPFFSGEVEPCINGRVLSLAAYFDRIDPDLVAMLLSDQLPDGGWNCYAPPSTVGSFASTICVLEGLADFEHARGADPAVSEARRRGEEYLLARRMYRRLTDASTADPEFLRFVFPPGWHYDILRGLDYFRAEDIRDERLADAIEAVRARADDEGRWPVDRRGEMVVLDTGEVPGQPSRWVTLRARRVLRWWDEAG